MVQLDKWQLIEHFVVVHISTENKLLLNLLFFLNKKSEDKS